VTLDPMTALPAYQDRAIELLNPRIQPHFRAFEWGSGWSTIWLGARCESVVSVEHDPEWFKDTEANLRRYGVENVELVLVKRGHEYQEYADHILSYPDGHFHIVCVDGRNRAGCIKNAMAKLAKPGGMLVVDDYPRAQYQEALALMDGWSHVLDYRGMEHRATGIWWRPEAS
jgi:predicted O-methyltransferase YrrM